ncbi:NAD+ synthase (glutamine-hydrolyzing) [Povalibacter uvarum]|uniref:Glutamine-dependent NAD(+) synthetase n=1 Tax=Povalibacter uvarum TaxID=732238 RepID=A0A841HRI7_9GAMM|nr:NAD+ synthase [Povalibacter uvarum]MBB6094929.1 NAD+ synthase (glutamine-hydrolyzing) [Povalibacter uvarum]
MPTSTLRIALAQLNLFVGDVSGNTQRVLDAAARARDELKADLVLMPELSLSGYPPEDLLFHTGLRRQVESALKRVREETRGIAAMVGYPEYADGAIYNAATVVRDGAQLANYRKQELPNYKVFDEKRYFKHGNAAQIIELNGIRIGLLICEDIWEPRPAVAAKAAGAQLLVVINGSPYSLGYQDRRESVVRDRVRDTALPVVYVNLLGGQDELVFDGGSFVMNAAGQVVQRVAPFVERLTPVDIDLIDGKAVPRSAHIEPSLSEEASVYGALVLGVRDYVEKHRFPGVVLGLSGGVDSALTLAIAVDALGADRVHVVMMPSRYTSQMSLDDAALQARTLGVRYDVISIEGMFEATLGALQDVFTGREPDTTEENIQARIRGVLLMAISNKTGRMLVTTGNKSEMAVGYATLYGDMNGGFAPIKDCSKMLVYRLANYRNAISPADTKAIPQRVIDRPPSAELRPDQKDSDSLPPYEVLDAILELFIEDDLSVDEITARGFDRATVGRVLDMVKRNEYKRRQAPPGVRISDRAFGRDWRYPITSGYRTR